MAVSQKCTFLCEKILKPWYFIFKLSTKISITYANAIIFYLHDAQQKSTQVYFIRYLPKKVLLLNSLRSWKIKAENILWNTFTLCRMKYLLHDMHARLSHKKAISCSWQSLIFLWKGMLFHVAFSYQMLVQYIFERSYLVMTCPLKVVLCEKCGAFCSTFSSNVLNGKLIKFLNWL